MKYPVLLTAVGLVAVGALMGNATADPPIKYVEGPTHYVQAPIPQPNEVTVYEFPQPCLDALDEADTIWRAAGAIDTKSSSLLDIISKTRMSIFDQDLSELATLEDRTRDLQARTVGNVETLSEALFNYQQDLQDCNEQLKNE